MSEFLSLVKVSYKNTYGLTDGKTKQSWVKRLTPVFILLALLPTLVSFTFLTREALVQLLPMQQEGIVLGLLMGLIATVIFFFGIFLIPSIFYFSKDVDVLLALPLKPETIVLSKFCVALVFEYITVFFIATPILAGYVSMVAPGPLFYVFLLIILLLIPIVPLILSSLVVMLVMMFLPFAKNKDFFNYLSGFLMLGFSLGLNMAITQTASSMDQNQIIALLQQGNNSLMNLYRFSIPTVAYAVKALVMASPIDLLFVVGLTLLFIVLFVVLAKLIYFKGAIGISETGANRKALKGSVYAKSTLLHHPLWTYTLKELRLMVRTPIYFLNNISTVILMPMIFGGMMFTNLSKDPDIEALMKMIPWQSKVLPVWLLAIGLAIGYFMSSVNLITPTAISREGSNVWFMKMIPMSYFQQALAKVLSGLLISLIGSLAFIIPFAIFFSLPPLHFIHLLIGVILACVAMNFWGMVVDIFHPKLVWEQEAVPVKQNINAVFTMIPGFGFGAGLIMVLIKLPQPFVESYGYGVLVLLSLILAVAMVFLLKSTSATGMEKIEA